jgi:hypothetical protein
MSSASATICSTVMRGSSEPNGSWKIGWARRRTAPSARSGRVSDVLAVEQDATGGRFVEPQHQIADRGLAGPGFADQSQDLARIDRKRHARDRAQRRPGAEQRARGREMPDQSFDLEQCGHDRLHQVEDLRLDGDVERGRRLVGDQQRRAAGQRHRDHRPLAHAARQLVRIIVDARFGSGTHHLRAASIARRAGLAASGSCSWIVSAIWAPIV